MVGNLEEFVGPSYTPEELAFISGWCAGTKTLEDMFLRKVPELEEWLSEWSADIEYDNCMDALAEWVKVNEEVIKLKNNGTIN